MTRRYLNAEEAAQALRAGRSVEQWLGVTEAKPARILRWARLDRERDQGFSTTLFEIFDVGGPEFLDIYEFPPVDADAPFGSTKTFVEVSEAIEHACAALGASPERFVNAGVLQDEYGDSISAKS